MIGVLKAGKAARLFPIAMAVVCALQLACLTPPQDPLRIGVNAWPPFELLYLARSRGYFKAEKVRADLVDFSSYTGILRAYHQGNIDGFLATLNEVQIADNFQDLPAVVLVVDDSFGGDGLIVRDGIRDLKALRGKRLAYEESALGSYELERCLEIAGLAPREITAVSRLPEEGEKDFERGTVDGVITYEPALGRLARADHARVLFSTRDIPGEVVDVLAMRRSVLTGRPDEVKRMIGAWFRAVDYARDHPREAATEMANQQGVTVDELLQGLMGARIPDRAENRLLLGSGAAPGKLHAIAARLGEFLVRHGLTHRAVVGSELISPDFLDAP